MKQKEKIMSITNYIKNELPEGCNSISCLGCPLQGPKENTIEGVIEDSICDMLMCIARFTEKSASEIEVANEITNEYNWEEDKYEVII